MSKSDKLSKSDKKLLTKAGRKTLKASGKKAKKGTKVDRSDAPLISSPNREVDS
jgi:hypothetical protein